MRGSGGVGFLVKEELFSTWKFEVLHNDVEDISWVCLSSKMEDTSIVMLVCYFPPETSSYRASRSN